MKRETRFLVRAEPASVLGWRFSSGFLVCLAALWSSSGCSTMSGREQAPSSEFEHGAALFAAGNYEAAAAENQRILANRSGSPDVALFNLGLISAYSANPRKDYPRALGYFRRLAQEHPRSAFVEQARVWIQVLEEHQRVVEERRRLLEEKRALARKKELLSREREKLNYTVERSRQVDIEIEKRRRQTRLK